jgi:predicted PurR-regulated permease PerM
VLTNLSILAVGVGFFLIYRFAAALFSLFVGLTLGIAVKPAVEWLRARGLRRWVGALAVTLGLGALFTGLVLLVLPILLDQVGVLLANGPHQWDALRVDMLTSGSRTVRRLAEYLPAGFAGKAAVSPAPLGASQLLGYGEVVGRNLFTIVAVLLLGFYWTLEGDRRVRELSFFAPLERRREIRAFIQEAEQKVGAYVRGQTVVCLVIGVLAFAMYSLIGLPHALVLGVIYAFGEAVPVLGPIIGTVVAGVVALSVSSALVAWVVLAAIALQLIENYLLLPRVMDKTVGVTPLVTILAITAFASVLGVAGAVLAIPMAAILQLLLNRFVLGVEAQDKRVPEGRDRVSVLRYEVQQVAQDIRKHLRARVPDSDLPPQRAETVEDSVESIATDLDHLLAQRKASW